MKTINKIFQIGFNRCGTSSLHEFFLANGINSIHWDGGRLAQAIIGNKAANRPLLTGYESFKCFTDIENVDLNLFPHVSHYKDLDKAYPDSKFILNTRNVDAWIESRMNWLVRGVPYKDIFKRNNGVNDDDALREIWRNQYLQHRADVIDYFKDRPDDLLVFDIENEPAKLAEFFKPYFEIRSAAMPKVNAGKSRPLKQNQPPRIAVITPYYKESLAVLRKCHESVIDQNLAAVHFMVADGFPQAEVNGWKVQHIQLPKAHGDNGNTPRGIGSLLADAEGYDFIAYLDADNWFHPGHLASLYECWQKTQAEVCCSFRTFHHLDGSELPGLVEKAELNFKHVDTSCFFLHRNCFDYLNIWLKMPKQLSAICDRIFYLGLLQKKYRFGFTKRASVAFRSQYKVHYDAVGIAPPEGAKSSVANDAVQWLKSVEGCREAASKLGFYPL